MHATRAVLAADGQARASIRVASMPSGHVYVRHLSDPAQDDAVMRLPDVVQPGRDAGRWWPPAMLDADWIAANHERFDVFHVHFGFDAKSPERAAGDLRAHCDAAGVPLVAHRARPPQSASSRRGAARRAARRPARVRGGGDHADRRARPSAIARALGAGRRGAAASARRRLGRRCRGRDRRTTATSSGCTPRACGRTWTWRRWRRCSRRRWPGCPARGCGSTSITRCSIPARTRTLRTSVTPCARSRPRSDRVELREHDYFSDEELWDVPAARSTSRCCRTASARTRAGWRPASIWAPRSSRRAAASTPSSDRA